MYSIVALSLGLAAYRDGLPLTFRSCFYPVLGERIWGWMGDLIDSVTIVTVVAGVCTSLGLGALQITNGLVFTGAVDSTLTDQQFLNINILVIWIVTLVATLSVVSGLELGIQYLVRSTSFLQCFRAENSRAYYSHESGLSWVACCGFSSPSWTVQLT